ncbi:MFS transporter [Mesorhizobium sp. VK9D]|uniref:MFS transporter n=1 Tax=Mesorhizobium australafricanum TaxID=3072311 RepID=UPI002A23DDD1|nr:MFS transporter [Mesorhizobium sp. VK9D]MDX8452314.1 MFS transporter [Mesorhizobium sp. VK9D]
MSGEERRWSFLALACLAVVLSLTTWFSATAVIPELKARWQLGAAAAAWLTNGVQAGFVFGALTSSILGLPDRWRLNRMMAGAAALAGAANLVLLTEPGAVVAILARFVTGIALAGVYPPAIKLMATWFRRERGLALGLLIAALTLGSALPHLVRAIGAAIDWRVVVSASSICAFVSAAIFGRALHEGPFPFARSVVDPRQIGAIIRDRPVMLANLGYFGHMWELYAMWGWFLAYAGATVAAGNPVFSGNVSLLTFAVIAVGALGAAGGGLLADRVGRCNTTVLSMALSGACALLIGVFFDGPSWLFVVVALVWGVSVIADSAQFSAAVTELAEPHLVGSALALQMGIGFAITIVAIWTLPFFGDAIGGWRWAFLLLVPGPAIGAAAMLALRRNSSAVKLAGGRR